MSCALSCFYYVILFQFIKQSVALVKFFIDSLYFLFSPQPEVLKPMFCLDLDGLTKDVSVCLLKTWCQDDPRDLAVTISHLLTKPQNTGKRKTRWVLLLLIYRCEMVFRGLKQLVHGMIHVVRTQNISKN